MPTIQGLEFIIESDIDTAVRKIDLLGQSLTSLKSSGKGGLGLTTAARQLKEFDDVLRNIDMSRFSKFALNFSEFAFANPKISKSFVTNMAGLQSVLASMSDADISKLERLGSALSKFPSQLSLTGLGSIGKSVQNQMADIMQQSMAGADPAAQASANLATIPPQVEAIGRAASGASGPLSIFFGLFKTVGGGLIGHVKGVLSGIITKITGFFNSIKRIAFYRLIRSVMRMITQGFTEGLKNMYAYSQTVGTQFAGSMDRLATSALYLKNSLASMAAPFINALAPAIDFVADKIAALFNLIAQFIARLSGKATYTAAKKVATTWQGAAENATGGAKKAVDEFRRYVLGFDELNILGSETNSGGSGGSGGAGGLSGEDMFEEREIGEGVSSFADAIREAVENHDWQSLGQTIGEKVNEIIDNVPWAAAGEKVGGFINALFTTAYWTLDTINFQNIGAGAAEFLNNALEEIDFTTVGATITAGFTSLIDTLIGFFGTLDWNRVGSSISDFITGIFDEGSSWLDETDWESFGEGMVSSARDFFEGSQGSSIANSISEFIGTALRSGGLTLKGAGKELIDGLLEQAQTEINEYGRNPDEVRASAIRNSLLTMLENILNPGTGAMIQLHMLLQPEELFDENHYSWQDWVEENIANPFMQGLTGDDNFSLSSRIEEGLESIKEHIGWFFTNGAEEISNKIQEGLTGIINRFVSFFGKLKKKLAYELSRLVDWLRANTPEYLQNFLHMDSWSVEYLEGGSKHNNVNKTSAPDVEVGVRLRRDGWTTLDNYVGELHSKPVNLYKGNYSTLDAYVGDLSNRTVNLAKGNYSTLDKYVGSLSTKYVTLGKSGWSTLDSYVGTISAKPLSLYKKGWNTLYDYTGTKVDVGVQLYKSGWTDFKSFIGLKNGGIVTKNGAVKFFRSGGWVEGAKAGAFPAYAGGAVNAGSVFVAGEAGPELVAHVNNRSEVLNASQIAQTMYHSTIAGMRAIAGDIASAVSSQINTGANNQPVVCEVYLDRDKIATAVTRGQQAQNRRYSSTAM